MRKPTARKIRKQRWKELIIECNNSSMSKKQLCEENGVNEKTFYYYQKILRDKLLESTAVEQTLPSFADVTSNSHSISTFDSSVKMPQSNTSPGLVIRKGALIYEISNNISPNLLMMLGGILNA